MDPRTAYLSSNRNARARTRAVQPPRVQSPVGAQTSTSVEDQWKGLGDQKTWPRAQADMPNVSVLPAHAQAQALREGANPTWSGLPGDAQGALRGGYQAGGFEGVVKAAGNDDWYSLPSWLRTQILIGARG